MVQKKRSVRCSLHPIHLSRFVEYFLVQQINNIKLTDNASSIYLLALENWCHLLARLLPTHIISYMKKTI